MRASVGEYSQPFQRDRFADIRDLDDPEAELASRTARRLERARRFERAHRDDLDFDIRPSDTIRPLPRWASNIDITSSESSPFVPPMPPVPESRDFLGNRQPSTHSRRDISSRPRTERRNLYQRGTSWPDHVEATNGFEGFVMRAPTDLNARMPALTPNFSPARQYSLHEYRDRPRDDSPSSFMYHPDHSVVSNPLSFIPVIYRRDGRQQVLFKVMLEVLIKS